MNIFNEKVKFTKVLWKELFIGVVEAIIWLSLLFIIVLGYNTELIEMLEFVVDNSDKVGEFYLALLPIFIIIALLIKLGFFIIKMEIPNNRKKAVTTKAAPRKTTTKKKTSKK
ncbi:MAG: hypothetical protein IJN90_03135 [Bacilli bacterium]|nr:hypothetical protein [Bacilli bacterium]